MYEGKLLMVEVMDEVAIVVAHGKPGGPVLQSYYANIRTPT
jgi:hypothetical protein